MINYLDWIGIILIGLSILMLCYTAVFNHMKIPPIIFLLYGIGSILIANNLKNNIPVYIIGILTLIVFLFTYFR
jgi:hypothetical protein